MNHTTITHVARCIEKHFPQPQKISSHTETIDFTIKHIATHLPILSPKSSELEFVKMDDIQKTLRKLNDLGEFLDELRDALNETE